MATSIMFPGRLTYQHKVLDPAGRRGHLLHLDASHGPESLVACGAAALLERLQDRTIEELKLWDEQTSSMLKYNLSHVQAKMARLSGDESEAHLSLFAHIEELAAQVATAQVLVVSAPLWNCGPPYILKQYFDTILHPGLTFLETDSGPHGLLGGGKPLVLITSAGGAGGKDYMTPWLLDMGAMMGFDVPFVVTAKNAAHGDRELLRASIIKDSQEAAVRVSQLLASTPATSLPMQLDGGNFPEADCDHFEFLRWLSKNGGVSPEGLEAIKAAKVNGELWLQASAEDWQSEELGLEDSDVQCLVSLQQQHRSCLSAKGD